MNRDMRFPPMRYVRPAMPQISLCKSVVHSMTVKLLNEHHLEFLSLTGGYTSGSSESTLFKMPQCWKSHAAHMYNEFPIKNFYFHISEIRVHRFKPFERKIVLFPYPCFWGTQKKHPIETILLSTHNIYFG